MQTTSPKTNTVLPADRYAQIAKKVKNLMAQRQAGNITESQIDNCRDSSQMIGYEDVATFIDHMQRGIRP